ncbi:MAG: glycosyltransferase family 2 protein [Proteobacteria bacterium]|nr:glycosyltransferase family 2 protein [Pseudomonadota bacterium]
MLKTLFFLSLMAILYVYAGYPVITLLLSVFKKRTVIKSEIEPFVTILIAAFNEEDCIENTLQNKLSLDYPEDKFEIIVISDESTDKTDDIVKKYQSQHVTLLRQIPRAGKTSALNMAVPHAKGDILVFSDANSLYDTGVLKKLMRNFQDPGVGYVTGKMIYTNPDGSTIGDGCSAYMKYENMLREFETGAGSVVGVDGGVDAVRKKLYQPMNADQLPDFVLPLKVIDQGYRVVYEPEAILKEPSLKASEDEYRMRVRVSLRALWALYDMKHLLAFSPSGLFSWQLWSHKVFRYLCFIFLIAAYFSNIFLWSSGPFYQLLFIIQTLLYTGAAISPVLEKKGYNSRLLYFLHYFVLLNVASAHAFLKFIMGQKMVTWTPRKG